MSQLQLIVNAVLTLFLPVMIGATYFLVRTYTQRMPEYQRAALEQFARMAVRRVEQQHADNPSKQALAEAYLIELFGAFRLPVPERAALITAIEAAVYEVRT